MSAASVISIFPSLPLASGMPIGRPPVRERADEFMRQVATVLPDLRRCARQLTRETAEADDLVQETCRRAIEARMSFAPGSSLRAWMMCIMRNHHRDRIRRQRREIFLGDRMDAFPAAVAEDIPEWLTVSDADTARAMASLPPLFRDAYALYAIGGLSYAEIADRLGIPCATVGTRLRRARLRLRALLGDRSTQPRPSEPSRPEPRRPSLRVSGAPPAPSASPQPLLLVAACRPRRRGFGPLGPSGDVAMACPF